MTAPQAVLEPTDTNDFGVCHIYCVDCGTVNKALCGETFPDDEPECPEDCGNEECVVCVDLLQTHLCPGS